MSDKQEMFNKYLENFHESYENKEEFIGFLIDNQNYISSFLESNYEAKGFILKRVKDEDILNELIPYLVEIINNGINHTDIYTFISLKTLYKNNVNLSKLNIVSSKDHDLTLFYLTKTSYKDICVTLSCLMQNCYPNNEVELIQKLINNINNEGYDSKFINNICLSIMSGVLDSCLDEDELHEVFKIIYPYVTDYTRPMQKGGEFSYGNFIDVICNYPDILKDIFAKCKRIKKKGFLKGGSNPLFYVTNIESIKILIDKGYDINERYYLNGNCQDPLYNEFRDKGGDVSHELIEAFIEHGYNINFTDVNGNNILFHSIYGVDNFIGYGVDVNHRNNFGYTYKQWDKLDWKKREDIKNNRRLLDVDRKLFDKNLTRKQYMRLLSQGANEHINVTINKEKTSFINFHRNRKDLMEKIRLRCDVKLLYHEDTADIAFVNIDDYYGLKEKEIKQLFYSLRKRSKTLRRFINKACSYCSWHEISPSNLLKYMILYEDVELECLRLLHNIDYETYIENGRKYRKCDFDEALIIHRNNELMIEYLLKTLMLNPNHVCNGKTVLDYEVSNKVIELCLQHGFILKKEINEEDVFGKETKKRYCVIC